MLRDGLKGTKRDATIACRLSLYPLKRNSVNRNPGSSRVSRSIHRLWRRNAGRPPQATAARLRRNACPTGPCESAAAEDCPALVGREVQSLQPHGIANILEEEVAVAQQVLGAAAVQ
jgi:hypothetical protein